MGWRWAFAIVGLIGITFAAAGFLLIKEPQRGRFDIKIAPIDDHEYDERGLLVKKKQDSLAKKYVLAFKAILNNKTCRWILAGGCCRFWQGYTVAFFSTKYFN